MLRFVAHAFLVFSCFACTSSNPFSHDSVLPTYLSKSQLGNEWKNQVLETGTVNFETPAYQIWRDGSDDQEIEVYYKSNHELPVVSVNLFFPYGSYLASQQGKSLVLEALSEVIRIGGTEDYAPEVFNQMVEDLASSLSFSYGDELLTVSFRSLSQNVEPTLQLFNQFLHYPRFDTGQLANWRLRKIKSIKTRKDNPEVIARVAYQQLLNDGSHLAKISRASDAKNIFQQDLSLSLIHI